jgi:hypothetical protein
MSKKPYPTRKRTGHSIESAAVSDTRQTNTTSTLARVWKINPTAPKGPPPQCTRVSNTPASCSTELVTSLCKRLQEQCILPRLPVSVLPSALRYHHRHQTNAHSAAVTQTQATLDIHHTSSASPLAAASAHQCQTPACS